MCYLSIQLGHSPGRKLGTEPSGYGQATTANGHRGTTGHTNTPQTSGSQTHRRFKERYFHGKKSEISCHDVI